MSPRRHQTRPFRIDVADQAKEHLKGLKAGDRASVVEAIEQRLAFEPTKQTRNGKPMKQNSLDAGFELRVGNLRVYYDVDDAGRLVNVLAVGAKDRNRVLIGGEEFDL